MLRRRRSPARWLALSIGLVAGVPAAGFAQQPPPQIGIAAVTVSDKPYTFDTGEQHKIRVSVVAKGLSHPFSLAFLSNGDALVTERGKVLRIVRNAAGGGQSPKLDPVPVAGIPETPAFRTGGLQEVVLHPKFADYGKVLRLREDGKVPADHPYVGKAATRPEIFSYGHRDQLGITVQAPTGTVLTAEHGPNGGDEINLILPGKNYGWPTSSFGRNYDGPRISPTPLPEGIEQPLLLWLPSIAPTGLTFYTGDRFPDWKGNLFVGSARRGEIPHTGGLERVVFNDKLEELRRETLLTELHQRIRDVRQGPDGLLYVITDEDDGALLRIEPAE